MSRKYVDPDGGEDSDELLEHHQKIRDEINQSWTDEERRSRANFWTSASLVKHFEVMGKHADRQVERSRARRKTRTATHKAEGQ
jgi:hypothetical protein